MLPPSLSAPPVEPPTGGSTFRRWLDQRAGVDSLLRVALDEPIPGGARWAYVFGSALLFLFFSQVLTGIGLALYYVPAANDAHVTVAYIVKVVAGGSFMRSLHSYGASAMIVVLLLHTIQTFFYGAYKGRRELVWLAGVTLFGLILGMAFTGYLLPWDQKAYFATAVGTNVMGEMPGIGNFLKQLLRGGNQMGTVTLSRFFVLHVFVLPSVITMLIVTHVYLFRRAGPAGPVGEDLIDPRLPVEPFYPRQLTKDAVFALAIAGLLAGLAYFFPVRLGPEANPADTAFLPRPEWYFRPLFEWLKFWPGRSAIIGIVVIPALISLLFVGLPFFDRSLRRHPMQRPVAVAMFCLILGGIVWVGVLSNIQDQRDPVVAAQMGRQERAIQAFMNAPFTPLEIGTPVSPAASSATLGTANVSTPKTPVAVAPGGGVSSTISTPATRTPAHSVVTTGPGGPKPTSTPPALGSGKSAPVAANSPDDADVAKGKDLYLNTYKCSDCHGNNGEGTEMAPKLAGIGSEKTAAQIANFIAHPSPVALDAGMPMVDEKSPDSKALVAFILSLKP